MSLLIEEEKSSSNCFPGFMFLAIISPHYAVSDRVGEVVGTAVGKREAYGSWMSEA